MAKIVLQDIVVYKTEMGTRIDYKYEVSTSVKKFLRGGVEPLFIEVPYDISNIPVSILAIPFVGTFSSISMIIGECEILVKALDKMYAKSLNLIQGVYRSMYPNTDISINVDSDAIVENQYVSKEKSLFFTGGVDATSALAELSSQKPLLVNIWGGDVWITDDDSHDNLKQYLDNLTTFLGLQYCFVKTNARAIFEEDKLGWLCEKNLGHKYNHGWWASIAHILVMTAVVAPLMYTQHIGTHYIGSTYDAVGKTFDANNAELIHAIKFASGSFEIVDSHLERNQKVGKIIKWNNKMKAPLKLKVCWYRIAGENCNNCEKCYRTIMNIICNHGNPNDYGFNVDENVITNIHDFLIKNTVNTGFWIPIQNAFKEERTFW